MAPFRGFTGNLNKGTSTSSAFASGQSGASRITSCEKRSSSCSVF